MLCVCLSNPSIIENMCIDRYASNKSRQPTYHIWTVAELTDIFKKFQRCNASKIRLPSVFFYFVPQEISQPSRISQNIKLQP